jgi:hypothetical protein
MNMKPIVERDDLRLRMSKIGMTATLLAVYADAPGPVVCEFLSGRREELRDIWAFRVRDALRACEALAAQVEGLPLRWNDVATLRPRVYAFRSASIVPAAI